MDDKTLLETCLEVTGRFENSTETYNRVSGNSDGMGISAGILQWNAGQGTLQILLNEIGSNMGWTKAQTFFKSDIHSFASMSPADAIQFAKDHYIVNDGTQIAPAAAACWASFLNQPESIAAQQDLAIKGPLTRSKALAVQYVPTFSDRVRPVAFFFDLVNQDGGMSKRINGTWVSVPAVSVDQATSWQAANAFASVTDSRCAAAWTPVLNNGDALSRYLLHYAWERAKWVRPQYIWDTVSRRGTIACRVGRVHETPINFTQLLD